MIRAVLAAGWLRRERGSASVELMGMMPLLLLAAFAGWQILLVAFTATSAENAARTASRAESRGEGGEQAGREAVSTWLRDGTTVEVDGTKATVRIRVPIVVPLISSDQLAVSGTAEMPETSG